MDLKMCFKYFYKIVLLSVMCPFIGGKLLPNFKNVIDLKDGEKDPETTFPTNSNPSMNLVDEQDHGVSHLCVYEHWLRNILITCNIDHSTLFACIGAIQGQINLCEKPTQKEITVPVCLHEQTSEIITCKYKDIGGKHLCLPRTTSLNIFKDSKISSNTTSRIPFRLCENKERFSCLNKGDIVFCNQLRVNQTKLQLESDDYKEGNQSPLKYTKESSGEDSKQISSNKKQQKPFYKTTYARKHKHKEQKPSTIFSRKKESHKHPKESNHKKVTNVHRIHGKNSYRTPSLERKHHKASAADKNKRKRNHKALNDGKYKKIADNYDSGRRDKNTSNNKVTTVQHDSYGTGKVTINTGIPQEAKANQYFHVLRCENCSIDHVIKVEEDAFDLKMWTLPSN